MSPAAAKMAGAPLLPACADGAALAVHVQLARRIANRIRVSASLSATEDAVLYPSAITVGRGGRGRVLVR